MRVELRTGEETARDSRDEIDLVPVVPDPERSSATWV
jgi:hypothetical protein